MPAIAASWSKDQLLDRATPELRASVKPEELRALFDAVSQLGPFVAYEGATGQANMAYMTGFGSVVSALGHDAQTSNPRAGRCPRSRSSAAARAASEMISPASIRAISSRRASGAR